MQEKNQVLAKVLSLPGGLKARKILFTAKSYVRRDAMNIVGNVPQEKFIAVV
jgi:hypothetical protein